MFLASIYLHVNQTTDLKIANMTLQTTENNIILQMDSCKDGLFDNVSFKGAWSSTDGILTTSAGVQINNLSASVQSKDNMFQHCTWQGLRSLVGLGLKFRGSSAVSITIDHLSNGGLTTSNPGSELVTVRYTFDY